MAALQLFAVVVVVLLTLSSVTSSNSFGSKPNIVFILADDLGYNNIGVHNHVTISPNIDSLFNDGMKLNFSYSHKWCAPTRSSLMTGRLPYHTGIEHGSLGSYQAGEQYLALSQDWTMMPRTLKNAGYSTHMLGKWNLGLWADRYTPTGRGFDTYLGYFSADEQYFTHFKWPPYGGHSGGGTAGYNTTLPSLYNITDFSNGTAAVNHKYDGMYSTYVYAEEARHIITARSSQPNQPFFLYMAAQSIHTPLEAPDVYMNMYPDAPNASVGSDAQVIHAMVTALDDMVGNITDALKHTGLWDNTFLVFTADNGGDTHGNNFPLRAGKFTTWEGGLRVVGAVSGGFLPLPCTQKVANGIIHVADWHPTFAHLAGVAINATGPRPVDGLNVWEHIASCGVVPSARTELLHHYDGPNQGAFRQGDMKLIIGGMSPWCWDANYPDEIGKHCIPGTGDPHDTDWRCTPCTNNGSNPCGEVPCLFNISNDPLEHNNIAQDHPDIVASMRERYNVLGNDTCTPAIAEQCLDYIGHDDQQAWVKNTLSMMRVAPLPGAGEPLRPPSPTPPPPPPPPIPLASLNGSYSMGWTPHDSTLTVSESGTVHVTTNDKHSCWSAAVGTVTSNGLHFSINATGPTCLRFGAGTVVKGATGIEIQWICTKPDGATNPDIVKPCGWPLWTKTENE